jgi:hypothetical protein
VLDLLALGKLRRFAIWYLLPRQLFIQIKRFSAFFVSAIKSTINQIKVSAWFVH